MYTIIYEFEEDGCDPITVDHIAPHQSLLEVALNHHIAINHNCGGVCSCSTCHVYIEEGALYLEEPAAKEKHFIERAANPKVNSRLSCQCLLQAGSGCIKLRIPDQVIPLIP